MPPEIRPNVDSIQSGLDHRRIPASINLTLAIGGIVVALVFGFVIGFISSSIGRDIGDSTELAAANHRIKTLQNELASSKSEHERLDARIRQSDDKNSQLQKMLNDKGTLLSKALEKEAALVAQLESVGPGGESAKKPQTTSEPLEMPKGETRSKDVDESILAKIKADAQKEWPDDYEMQNYERDNQIKAYRELTRLNSYPDVPSDVLTKIKAKAKADWPDDYEMQLYTVQGQIDAYLDR